MSQNTDRSSAAAMAIRIQTPTRMVVRALDTATDSNPPASPDRDAALGQREKALHGVRVNRTAHVFAYAVTDAVM